MLLISFLLTPLAGGFGFITRSLPFVKALGLVPTTKYSKSNCLFFGRVRSKFWPSASMPRALMAALLPPNFCIWTFPRICPARIRNVVFRWPGANLASVRMTPRIFRDFSLRVSPDMYVLNDNLLSNPLTGDDVHSECSLSNRCMSGHQTVRGVAELLFSPLGSARSIFNGLVFASSTIGRVLPINTAKKIGVTVPCALAQPCVKSRASRAGDICLRVMLSSLGLLGTVVSAATTLPVGASFSYKPQDGLWWLGTISGPPLPPDCYSVSFLDEPGPVKLALPAIRYATTVVSAVPGSWCLQVHEGSASVG